MKVFGLIILVAAMSGLTACGRDAANALKEYKAVQLEKPHGKVTPNQVLGRLAFRISTLNSSEGKEIAEFYEGAEGIAQIKVEVTDSAVQSYKVEVMNNTLSGLSLVSAPGSKNVFHLKWTPPTGILSGNVVQSYAVQIRATSTAMSNPNLPTVYQDYIQTVFVMPSKQQPVVASHTVPGQAEEGENKSFTISVKDPGAKGTAPRLDILPYSGGLNAENLKFDAINYFGSVIPQVSGPSNGVWTYTYTLALAGRQLPQAKTAEMHDDKNADGINLCFDVRVESQTTGNRSEKQSHCIKVMYAAQPPSFDWASDTQKLRTSEDLTAGAENTISFTAKTFNGKGSIKAKAVLAKIPLEKGTTSKIDCGDQSDATTKTCTITLTPACSIKLNTKFDLTASAQATLGKTSKSFTEIRKLNIYKKAESCEAAAPKASAT